MFASKTPEAAGFTPQPYRFYFSGKSMPASALEGWENSHAHVYADVANQWHGLQSNAPNPILVAHRLTGGAVYYGDLAEWPTQAEIDHAHKVLQRLARLRELYS